MLVHGQALSCRKRTVSIGKLGLTLDNHLSSPMKEGFRGKHYACNEEVKTAVMKWLKEQSTEFYEAEIHALF